MEGVEWVKGKRIIVMGLGVNGGGLGIALWLLRHGARLTVTDMHTADRLVEPMADLERAYLKEYAKQSKGSVHKIRYVLGGHDGVDFTDADMVIRNPGVPHDNPHLTTAKNAGVQVEMDIALFMRLCPFPITAVTGTKGKSTVTSLIAHIAKLHDKRTVLGGNIGISPFKSLDTLLRLAKKRKPIPPPIVLELSSWHLEGCAEQQVSPHVAVMTNIMPDHLNRYAGYDDYKRAKSAIIAFQKENDIAVLNGEDRDIQSIQKHPAYDGATNAGKRVWFGLKPKRQDGWYIKDEYIVRVQKGMEVRTVPCASIRMPGRHNIANVIAAVAAADAMGIPMTTIKKAIRSFAGVPGRLEYVATIGGIEYINDTTATMPQASMRGIEAIAEHQTKGIILIAGGTDKELDYAEWARVAAKHTKHMVLFEGTATEKMLHALSVIKKKPTVQVVPSMTGAMQEANRHAKKGDVILLSPGCASFGIFRNEFHRGDAFVQAVKRISRKTGR